MYFIYDYLQHTAHLIVSLVTLYALSYRYASNLTDMDAIPKSAPAASTPAVESNGSNGARKKRDRFNGMSEDEVLKLTIPDQMCHNLDIVIVSIVVNLVIC